MRKRFYLDTSVFGGYFDTEFLDTTRKLFDEIINEKTIILYSELTESELENAPKEMINYESNG